MMSLFNFFSKQKNPFYIPLSDAKKLLDENKDVLLIDVRTKEEYLEYRIENAISLDVNVIYDKMPVIFPDTNKTYLLYCRSGVRSLHACSILKSLGYQKVYDLGGIINWPFGTIK